MLSYMTVHLETYRFILRDIEFTDAKDIFELDSDPDVHEFLGKKPIKTIEEAKTIIDYIRKQYQDYGIGRWAIIDKKNQAFVGWTGIKYETVLRTEFDYYDLGYRLKKKYWGKKIATETALAVVDYGFNQLKLNQIGGAADEDHIVSNKILQKAGLKFVDTFKFDNSLCNWYNLKKGDYFK